MTTRPYATTNARIVEALEIVDELINWALADAEHAAENDAPATARSDRARAGGLRRCRIILENCTREG